MRVSPSLYSVFAPHDSAETQAVVRTTFLHRNTISAVVTSSAVLPFGDVYELTRILQMFAALPPRAASTCPSSKVLSRSSCVDLCNKVCGRHPTTYQPLTSVDLYPSP